MTPNTSNGLTGHLGREAKRSPFVKKGTPMKKLRRGWVVEQQSQVEDPKKQAVCEKYQLGSSTQRLDGRRLGQGYLE
ncbi:hypothetical protein ILUMI_09629 [Ignelater luminosus]|uniref:Uncharacterized protein n=1 Tax=Ignelater luminosus TaxID=2038154 RepID=A0A8K0GC87_IGNLU|nr:hypothetical protein ILUMI_09629 [Ignelater luminosus]